MQPIILWASLLIINFRIHEASEETGIKIRTFEDQLEEVTAFSQFQALVGNKIQLPCDATASSDDSISLILWYKNDRKSAPIYSIDARDGPIEKAKHFIAENIKSRVKVFLKVRPTLLQIEPLLEEDHGVYVCRVDFKWARTVNTVSNLSVIVPPKQVLIKDEQNNDLRNVIGPFYEQSSLRLICQCYEGNPPPSLIWFKNGVIIDDTYSFINSSDTHYQDSLSSFTINELELKNLERSDLNSVLECQALNNNISSPVSSSVVLDINYKPSKVEIVSLKRALVAGESVEIICQSKFSRPSATINWYLGSQTITSLSRESISEDGNVTTSVIKFVPQIDHNGADLICEADINGNRSKANIFNPDNNEKDSGYILRDTWTLNINYTPKIILKLMTTRFQQNHSNDAFMVQEGDEITFNCDINANPEATIIQWLKDDKPLQADENGSTLEKSYLHIKPVKRKHKARYRCLAANTKGSNISNEIELQILNAPVCGIIRELENELSLNRHLLKPSSNVTYTIKPGESVNISCKVDANPVNVTFYWTLNGDKVSLSSFTNQPDEVNQFKQIDHGTESILIYTPVTLEDYGYLACWAKNKIGSQNEPCLFTLIPSAPVDGLKSCVISNQTWNSLFVECTSSDRKWNQPSYTANENESFHSDLSAFVSKSSQTFYHLEAYNYNKTRLLLNLTSMIPQFDVSGLEAGTSYIFKVYSTNSQGRGHSIELAGKTIVMLTRKQDYLQSETFKHSQLLLIICVFISLLLLSLLIFLIILKICKRDKTSMKRKQSSSKEDELSQDSHQKGGEANSKLDNQLCIFSQQSQEYLQMLPLNVTNNPDVIPINPDLLSNNTGNCSVSSKLFNLSSIEALHKAIVVSDIDALKQNVHLNPHVMVIDNQPLTQPVLTLQENTHQTLHVVRPT